MDKEEFVTEFIHRLSYSFMDKSVMVHLGKRTFINADWFRFPFVDGYVDLYIKKRFVAEVLLKQVKGITEGYKITLGDDQDGKI